MSLRARMAIVLPGFSRAAADLPPEAALVMSPAKGAAFMLAGARTGQRACKRPLGRPLPGSRYTAPKGAA